MSAVTPTVTPNVTHVNSQYYVKGLRAGIVHIGLGAFHRAHQAVYVEKFLNRHSQIVNKNMDVSDVLAWGICAANIRSNHVLVDQLNAQQGSYHVVEFESSNAATVREVNAISRAIFAGESKAELLAIMQQPDIRIVTLTVTEKGYCLSAAEQRLRLEDPAIQADIANPDTPVTVPGLLLAALRMRHAQGIAPFTILSCDNMPENGDRTRLAVTQLAEAQCPELVSWLNSSVAFPNSMVDRIVPSIDAEGVCALEKQFGFKDSAALSCESFTQWVVEDNFPLGRPDWENDGVQMVADVHPFETMKLRLLNGSHSILAYLGSLCGWETVAEAICNDSMSALIRRYMEQTLSTLDMPSGVDTHAYIDALLYRFSNDSLNHKLSQIAMDGSQKIPQRWLRSALLRLEQGLSIKLIAFAVASWMCYVKGVDRNGQQYVVSDPLANEYAGIYQSGSSAEQIVTSLLALRDVFPAALADNQIFCLQVLAAFNELNHRKPLAALEYLLLQLD